MLDELLAFFFPSCVRIFHLTLCCLVGFELDFKKVVFWNGHLVVCGHFVYCSDFIFITRLIFHRVEYGCRGV
jgi:hypothetical protein